VKLVKRKKKVFRVWNQSTLAGEVTLHELCGGVQRNELALHGGNPVAYLVFFHQTRWLPDPEAGPGLSSMSDCPELRAIE
jgi:hypothetical protein